MALAQYHSTLYISPDPVQMAEDTCTCEFVELKSGAETDNALGNERGSLSKHMARVDLCVPKQQATLGNFLNEFNRERPHEALNMKCLAQVYTTVSRQYNGLPELRYPFHDRPVLVTACRRNCIYRKKNQHQRCPGWTNPRNQGSRRRHLAGGQLYGL